jgi:hypothetical protein
MQIDSNLASVKATDFASQVGELSSVSTSCNPSRICTTLSDKAMQISRENGSEGAEKSALFNLVIWDKSF